MPVKREISKLTDTVYTLKITKLNGEEFLSYFNEEDLDLVEGYAWTVGSKGYVRCNTWLKGDRLLVILHREILAAKLGHTNFKFVDHINHCTLDNQRNNLRPATHAENCQNASVRKDSTTKFKGVYFHKIKQKYIARIKVNNRNIYLGSFETAEYAAAAYMRASETYHKDFSNY